MYFNIKCIGKLTGPTNEFERSLVFETGEFERPKFDCISRIFSILHKITFKMFIFWNLGLFCVIYLTRVRSLGNRPLIVKRVVIGSPGGWKLSTIFML